MRHAKQNQWNSLHTQGKTNEIQHGIASYIVGFAEIVSTRDNVFGWTSFTAHSSRCYNESAQPSLGCLWPHATCIHQFTVRLLQYWSPLTESQALDNMKFDTPLRYVRRIQTIECLRWLLVQVCCYPSHKSLCMVRLSGLPSWPPFFCLGWNSSKKACACLGKTRVGNKHTLLLMTTYFLDLVWLRTLTRNCEHFEKVDFQSETKLLRMRLLFRLMPCCLTALVRETRWIEICCWKETGRWETTWS